MTAPPAAAPPRQAKKPGRKPQLHKREARPAPAAAHRIKRQLHPVR